MMRKFSIKISLIILTLVGCNAPIQKKSRTETLPFYCNASFTPHWIDPTSDSLQNFHSIPNFQLINQHGESVSNHTLKGKIYVADFFFATCPGICPKMTKNMKLIQNHFMTDSNVALLSHSVTPERDSVSVLAQYAMNHQITSPNWHLLTGPRKEIYALGRKSYFVEEDLGVNKTEEEFLHTENFVLIDKQRHIRGIYNGLNKTAIQQLIVDIETLKKRAIKLTLKQFTTLTSVPSFNSLYEEHKDLVYNLCLNYLQNQEDAEEVFQDVFLKINKKLGEFNQKSTYKTWIYRISINACLDFIRARKRKKRFAFLQSLSNTTVQIASPFTHPGIALEHKEALEILFAQINSLPEKQKTALVLKSIDGLSQKQIAEILNVSEKAVESLLSRARKKLKEKRVEQKD